MALAFALGFIVIATGLIVGESWRSSRNESRRRVDVGETLEGLQVRAGELAACLESWEHASAEERER